MVKFVVSSSSPSRRCFWWPIKVRVPNEDQNRAGQTSEFVFKARFEALPRDEAKELFDEVMALPEGERAARQDDLIRRVVVNFDDQIVDDQKPPQPMPFSAELLDQLLQDNWVQVAFWRAYGEALVLDGGRKGN